MFPKYKLTDRQIQGIANIVLHEQGTVEGWYAEASQIANRTDINGDKYATGTNAVKTVTSGWYAKGEMRYLTGTTNKQIIEIVKNVFCKGFRTLPRYVDEHDCMSDISSAKNATKNIKYNKSLWEKHKTKIRNRMGSAYIFYDFPGGYKTGADPFGYTKVSKRKRWGDFCYTVKEAKDNKLYLKFPKRNYYKYGDGKTVYKNLIPEIKRIQGILKLKGFYKGEIDGLYLSKTKEAVEKFQKKHDLQVNGCFGKKCFAKL